MKKLLSSKKILLAIFLLFLNSSLLFSQETLVEKSSEIVSELEKKSDVSDVKEPIKNDAVEILTEKKEILDVEDKSTVEKSLSKQLTDQTVNVIEKEKKEKVVEKKVIIKKYTGDGLLSITDGDYRYDRIPGNEKPKSADEKFEKDINNFEKNSKEKEIEESSTKIIGLFGLSKSITDLLAWGFLFVLVILIFLLYRVRSRSKRR